MQFGHLGIALAIVSLDPRPETFLVVGAAQFLPNADSLIIRAGWRGPTSTARGVTVSCSAGAVGALAVALFGPWLGGLALASIVAHVLADLPTDTGLPLLLPFSGGALFAQPVEKHGYWGARCTSATTAAVGVDPRGRGVAVWLGATRGSWHETRHVRRARAAGARTPVAVPATAFEATLLYYARLYPRGLLALVGTLQRVGGGRRQTTGWWTGQTGFPKLARLAHGPGALERRGLSARPVLDHCDRDSFAPSPTRRCACWHR